MTKQKIRFLALDPAGPWFDLQQGNDRLQKTDAKYVDVIHTNQGNVLNVRIYLNQLWYVF